MPVYGSRWVHSRQVMSTVLGRLGGGLPEEGRTIFGGMGAPCSSLSSWNLKMKSKVLVVALQKGM